VIETERVADLVGHQALEVVLIRRLHTPILGIVESHPRGLAQLAGIARSCRAAADPGDVRPPGWSQPSGIELDLDVRSARGDSREIAIRSRGPRRERGIERRRLIGDADILRRPGERVRQIRDGPTTNEQRPFLAGVDGSEFRIAAGRVAECLQRMCIDNPCFGKAAAGSGIPLPRVREHSRRTVGPKPWTERPAPSSGTGRAARRWGNNRFVGVYGTPLRHRAPSRQARGRVLRTRCSALRWEPKRSTQRSTRRPRIPYTRPAPPPTLPAWSN
jgi:hypothetical protein